MNSLLHKLLPHLCLSLLSLFLLEAGLRFLSTLDEEGNVFFRNLHLKPFHLPIRLVGRTIHEYESKASGPIYDPDLGWALRPNAYHHNADGFITTNPTPPRIPSTPGKLRIALLGDSYTQGDFETGWWRVLENQLHSKGVDAEILNFGVGGYGMDQSYLRWRRDCKQWQPQIVVFGFMADACTRNLNLMRLLRDPGSGIPFMKPRFILREQHGLELVNCPTPQPDKLTDILSNLANWPLIKYEHFYSPTDYRPYFWRRSRLAAVMEAELEKEREAAKTEEFFNPQGEAAQLALRLLARMRQEVEATGAQFYVAILPTQTDIECLRNQGSTKQGKLTKEIQKQFPGISLESPLAEFSTGRNLDDFFFDSHYRAEFNELVGKTLADYLSSEAHPQRK